LFCCFQWKMSHTRLFYSKATGTQPYSSWPMNPHWKHLESGRCLVHRNLVCTILLGSIALQFVQANKNKMNHTETWWNGEAQILKQKIGDTNMHEIPVQRDKSISQKTCTCLPWPSRWREWWVCKRQPYGKVTWTRKSSFSFSPSFSSIRSTPRVLRLPMQSVYYSCTVDHIYAHCCWTWLEDLLIFLKNWSFLVMSWSPWVVECKQTRHICVQATYIT
jgi:hypothetical protein